MQDMSVTMYFVAMFQNRFTVFWIFIAVFIMTVCIVNWCSNKKNKVDISMKRELLLDISMKRELLLYVLIIAVGIFASLVFKVLSMNTENDIRFVKL